MIAAERGHFQAAHQHVARAIQIARASGPAFNLPHYLCTKAELQLKAGDLAAAERDARDALANANGVGNKRAAAAAAIVLADVSAARGQHIDGEAHLEEAAAIYKTLGARAELGETYMRLSQSAGARGDARAAQRFSDLAFKATRKTSLLVER
jgi:tetratricopeptide (TPR) repeat protein